MNAPRTGEVATPWRPDASMNRQFLHGDDGRPPLRIGIVCHHGTIPRHALQIVEDIHACGFARLQCVIDWLGSDTPAAPSRRRFDTLLYRLYQRLLEPLCQREAEDPLEPAPLPPPGGDHLFPGPVFRVDRRGGPSFDAMVERIACMELDLIINLVAPELDVALGRIARHGVWSYRLDAQPPVAAGDDLVRKTLENRANTAHIALVRFSANASHGDILRQAWFATSPGLSVLETRHAPCFGSSWFVLEKLAELRFTGKLAIEGRMARHEAPLGAPGNRQMIAFVARRLRGIARRAPSLLRGARVVVDWKIAIRHAPVPLPEENETLAIADFQWLPNPPGRFRADPFLLRHEGRTWLFFEEFDRQRGKGHIACAEVKSDGRLGEVFIALEKPWHLSYPQVFVHDGELYMVPESVEHQTVDLYRARRFPHDWVHEKQLLDVAVVDATLQCHDGRWWMFASPMAVPGHAPVTCLWTADSLTGDWRLAPAHTVCSDVHHARSAGALFTHGKRRYRVSQDCSARYGAALWFNRIEQWDEHAYRETPEIRINGRGIAGLTGIHSYNRAGNIEVIDGRFEVVLGRDGTPLREQFPAALD